MKLIKYGEPGCGKVEAEGDGKFINFLFTQFKSRGPGHYAELYDDDGNLISTTNPTT